MHDLLHSFDTSVATQVAKLPNWTAPFMSACTVLGLPVVIVVASLIIAATAYARDAKNISTGFALVIVAEAANGLLKMAFQRIRPETLYVSSMAIKSYSFPSGHAFGSTVFYGLVAYLCFRHLDKPTNIIVAAAFAVLVVVIGISRISLGAHFPSDVLGGWLLGSGVLLLIIKACGL